MRHNWRMKLWWSLILLVTAVSLSYGSQTGAVSRVVAVTDPTVATGIKVNHARVAAMVSDAIRSLTSKPEDTSAWKEFVSAGDIVAIKVNTQSAPLHATRLPVVEAIAQGLAAAGVASTNIIVWDRSQDKLRAAGFVNPNPHFLVQSVQPHGWDAERFYEKNIAGKLIWGDLLFGVEKTSEIDTKSHLPRLLTGAVTKIINIPALHDNEGVGLAGCLQNVTMYGMDNTRRFEAPGMHGIAVIPEMYRLPEVGPKTVLHVMDALVAGFAAGPAFKPHYSWPHATLYFSRDPVAIDTICLELVEAKRKAANVPAIGARANHIQSSALYGIGQSDRQRIELIEVRR
jgi:hypothetical protein